jgi:protein-tyrosine phosphatase
MPGRHETFSECKKAISDAQVELIICLAPLDEIETKSPKYFYAIESADLPCERKTFEVPDFGIPQNGAGFVDLARDVASRLRSGSNILVHCAGGIGRTGTFAVCVLLWLGLDRRQSCHAIEKAGSHPETQPQRELILQVAKEIKKAHS